MTTNIGSVIITAGPSASAIWDAAKFAYSNNFTVDFTGIKKVGRVERRVQFTMSIIGVRHEDGSGHSFVLDGFCDGASADRLFDGQREFYYNARTRTGHLNLAK